MRLRAFHVSRAKRAGPPQEPQEQMTWEQVAIVSASAFGAFLLFAVIVAVVWYIESRFHRYLINYDAYKQEAVKQTQMNVWAAVFDLFVSVPLAFISALSDIFLSITGNVWKLFFVFLLAAACLGWNTYMDPMVHGYIIARQCVAMPFAYFFAFPLLNIARIAYNAVIIVWDFIYDMIAFWEFQPIIIFIKCTIHTLDATNMFVYFSNIFFVFTQDLVAWFVAGFLTNDFDITNTVAAVGLFVDSFVVVLTCFCQYLGFFWQAVAIAFRLPSVAEAWNAVLNFFIRLAQIPINTVMVNPPDPVFDRAAIGWCLAVESVGDAAEDILFLAVETGWGVFSNQALPEVVAEFFSTQWSHILSDPLCAVGLLANMTVTAGWHYNALNAPDGSGIGYFQFGTIFDQFKGASFAFGSLFCLFNNDAIAFVTESLLTIVNFFAFLFEWILGNVFYFIFGGPALPLYPAAPFQSFADFLEFYLPNYWFKPGTTFPPSTYVFQTALNDMFVTVFQSTQAFGNLVANLLGLPPVAGVIQHTLNVLICLLQIIANLVSYSFPILTFSSDNRTTARQVNVDNFFNELYFLAQSAGDFFRQFGSVDPMTNTTCVPNSPNEADQDVFCCTGNFVQLLIDVFTATLQQIVHFFQDIVCLPTGTVQFCISFIPFNMSNTANCIRIPDLSVALLLLDAAICDFACAIFAVIPLLSDFQCTFQTQPPPPPNTPPAQGADCGHVSTCSADLLCKLLLIITVPLRIINGYFVQIINGQSFSSYTVLGQFAAQSYADWLANAFVSFGQLFDCILCAFITGGTNCSIATLIFFQSVGKLIQFLPLILTNLFFIVFKLVLAFLVGLFNGNPIQALIDFIVGLLENLFGGLAQAVVNLLVALFNAIGLGVIGDLIQVIYDGLCPILEGIVNAIIAIILVLTFGIVQLGFANFCCFGGANCVPTNKRGTNSPLSVVDGVLYMQQLDWITYIAQTAPWEAGDPCNATMTSYIGVPLANISEWQMGGIAFCLYGRYWNNRTDGQAPMPAYASCHCDRIVSAYLNASWEALPPDTQSQLIDCMQTRISTDAFRAQTNLSWIPSDIMYSTPRKLYFTGQLVRGLSIYWQFTNDQRVTSAVFLSPNYQQYWARMGLNTSFYAGITTPQQIVVARAQYRLADYFAWNNATQLEAVESITLGFWSMVNSIVTSLMNTTSAALSDSEMDPTVFILANYTLGSPTSGATASLYSLFSELFVVAQNISAYWSNPVNLKKRTDAWAYAKEGGWGMYLAAKEQLTMAAAEYELLWRDSASFWRGARPLNETQEFLRNYHHTLKTDKRSVVYRLAHWWEKARPNFMRASPVHNARYNYTAHLFQYRDAKTGEMRSETGYNRLWRLWGAVREGSPQSRRRWEQAGYIWTVAKERLYHATLKNNMAFAVDYIRATYEEAWIARQQMERVRAASEVAHKEYLATVEREVHHHRPTESSQDVVARYFASLTDGNVKLVRTREGSHDYEVYRLQRKSQELHCVNEEMAKDGLCQGYVRAPYYPLQSYPAESNDTAWSWLRKIPSVAVPYGYIRYSSFLGEPNLHPVSERGEPVTTAKGVAIPYTSTVNYLATSLPINSGLVAADGIIDLTCATNITFGNTTLCEACFFLDQFLGRVENGLGWMLGYFVSGQFTDSLNVALSFFDYCLDDNATVVVGGGPQYSVRTFPSCWGFGYDMGYLDDPGNKTGISDITAALNNPNFTGANITTNITLNYYYVNGWVGYLILRFFGWWWQIVVDVISLVSGGSNTFTAFVEATIFCDWVGGTNYLGTHKRFSVGQTIFGYLVAFIGFSLLFVATIQVNVFNAILFFVVSFINLGMMISSFLVIQDGFAFLCWPGLPVNTANDVLYFLAYTLVPKCSWFLSWTITDPGYNNDQCYYCANAAQWHILNCAADLGFGDIFANVIFMLQRYSPETLQWILTSRFPILAYLVAIPYINERLTAFQHVDFGNEVQCSNYLGCNYLGTLFTNFFIAAVLVYLATFLYPLLPFLALFLYAFFNLLFRIYQMIDTMLEDMWVSAQTNSKVVSGLIDTPVPEHVEDEYSYVSADAPIAARPLGGTGEGNQFLNAAPPRRRFAYSAEKNRITVGKMVAMARMTWDNLVGRERKMK
jgi:hypothetical protein